MKIHITTIAAILVALFAVPTTSEAKKKPKMNLDQGVSQAMSGTEAKWVGVDGHIFHIKPPNRSGTGEITATGRISHHLGGFGPIGRPDDQVDYTIKKTGNKVTDITVSIDRGGLGKIVGMASDDIAKWFREGGKLTDGSWEGACRQIIVHIAARL